MEATTIYKKLNDIFEELYRLFDETISNPEYMSNKPDVENCVIQFTDAIRIDCEWDMTDEERDGSGTIYFESGHNDVNAVYYPFDSTKTDIDLVSIQHTLNIWKKTLECIQHNSKRHKHFEKAVELNQKIKHLKL